MAHGFASLGFVLVLASAAGVIWLTVVSHGASIASALGVRLPDVAVRRVPRLVRVRGVRSVAVRSYPTARISRAA